MIVGYFDPDYGEVLSKENHEEKIIQMLNNHDLFFGGFLTLPLVRFGLFNTDLNIDIEELRAKISNVNSHLDKWASFIANTNEKLHSIHVSHTDQDMLAITIHMRFNQPIPLKENEIMYKISPVLSVLQEMSLI